MYGETIKKVKYVAKNVFIAICVFLIFSFYGWWLDNLSQPRGGALLQYQAHHVGKSYVNTSRGTSSPAFTYSYFHCDGRTGGLTEEDTLRYAPGFRRQGYNVVLEGGNVNIHTRVQRPPSPTCKFAPYEDALKQLGGVLNSSQSDFVFSCTYRGQTALMKGSENDLLRLNRDSNRRILMATKTLQVFNDKKKFCKIINELGPSFTDISPPCVILPLEDNSHLDRFSNVSAVIFKVPHSAGGNGAKIFSVRQLKEENFQRAGMLQAFFVNPLLYTAAHEGKSISVKVDLRIYGIITSFDPPRVYISRHGYFRTGDHRHNFSSSAEHFNTRGIHITNNGVKLEGGYFVFQKDPDERTFSSAGTLRKFRTIARNAGLNPVDIWSRVEDKLVRLALV